MIPKLSIAIHSGVFDYWPQLQNLLKSFLLCNEYPNIEIILVESGGNKKIRDWFEKIDFDDFFVNLDGQKTDIKKPSKVSVEKTLKFIDFHSSVTGLFCFNQSISKCIESFDGGFFVMMAEDNQFIIEGDLITDYIKILNHFGRNSSMISFFSLQNYKFYKKNNAFVGPHTISSSNISFFTPVQQKWDFGSICHKSLYDRIRETKAKHELEEEDALNVHHGLVEQNTHVVSNLFFTNRGEFRRIYSSIPSGIWMNNQDRQDIIKKIKDSSKSNPNYILYKTIKKEYFLEKVKNFNLQKPITSEELSIEN